MFLKNTGHKVERITQCRGEERAPGLSILSLRRPGLTYAQHYKVNQG